MSAKAKKVKTVERKPVKPDAWLSWLLALTGLLFAPCWFTGFLVGNTFRGTKQAIKWLSADIEKSAGVTNVSIYFGGDRRDNSGTVMGVYHKDSTKSWIEVPKDEPPTAAPATDSAKRYKL